MPEQEQTVSIRDIVKKFRAPENKRNISDIDPKLIGLKIDTATAKDESLVYYPVGTSAGMMDVLTRKGATVEDGAAYLAVARGYDKRHWHNGDSERQDQMNEARSFFTAMASHSYSQATGHTPPSNFAEQLEKMVDKMDTILGAQQVKSR